jgi:hypothetical protein
VEKDGQNNWKIGKVGWTISQMPVPRLKHDKIQEWWVSNTLSKSMLETYDGAIFLRWNIKVEPVVVWWVVQRGVEIG